MRYIGSASHSSIKGKKGSAKRFLITLWKSEGFSFFCPTALKPTRAIPTVDPAIYSDNEKYKSKKMPIRIDIKLITVMVDWSAIMLSYEEIADEKLSAGNNEPKRPRNPAKIKIFTTRRSMISPSDLLKNVGSMTMDIMGTYKRFLG